MSIELERIANKSKLTKKDVEEISKMIKRETLKELKESMSN